VNTVGFVEQKQLILDSLLLLLVTTLVITDNHNKLALKDSIVLLAQQDLKPVLLDIIVLL